MKSTRLNLCVTLREALIESGYSTVKTVNAVNSALGELDKSGTRSSVKLGAGRLTKNEFKVTESTSIGETYSGKITTPLRFDAFNSQLEKLEKIAGADFTVTIPAVFIDWLDRFAKGVDKEEKATETIAK